MKCRSLLAVGLSAAAALPASASAYPRGHHDPPASADAVLHWNAIAQREVVPPAPGVAQPQPTSMSSMAFVQAAVYNAVVAIRGGYEPYGRGVARQRGASVDAAVATAAHGVLVHYFPARAGQLDADLTAALEDIPAGRAKRRGAAVGRTAAQRLINSRAGDGWLADIGFTMPAPAPGVWRLDAGQAPLVPWLSRLRPFTLRRPDQFRPGPPPRLGSPEYAAAFNEVKDFGRIDSTVRTPEQTLYAVWWLEFAETSVNRLARQLATQRRTHLWQASRMFALLNMSLYDAYIANLDSKYEYNHWRPYTAIRQAALDGNPATVADANWEPLRTTPPFPEYVSGHATGTAATMNILERTFGGKVSFTMDSMTAPPGMPTRSFRSFKAAAAECADSRVRVGFHFRYATDRGLIQGRAVAGWLEENYLEFRRGSQKD